MKIIVENFLILLLLLYSGFVSVEYITVNKEITTARSFHSACIDSIENSNFDSSVISKWVEKAQEYGFTLLINDISAKKGEKVIPCYYVSLNYVVSINLLGIKEESSIKGYAR